VTPFVVQVAPGARRAVEALRPGLRHRMLRHLQQAADLLSLRAFPEDGVGFHLPLGEYDVLYRVDAHARVVWVEELRPSAAS
jgi:hypothetical protein